jgi:hypothetical protein
MATPPVPHLLVIYDDDDDDEKKQFSVMIHVLRKNN